MVYIFNLLIEKGGGKKCYYVFNENCIEINQLMDAVVVECGSLNIVVFRCNPGSSEPQ